MKSFFLDANVVFDFLADRKPHSTEAMQLFALSEAGKIKLIISALSFSNLYFLLSKYGSHQKALSQLKVLQHLVFIAPVNDQVIAMALQQSFHDFEDGLQNASAEMMKGLAAIVTRNPKDFSKSKLAILSPKEALLSLN